LKNSGIFDILYSKTVLGFFYEQASFTLNTNTDKKKNHHPVSDGYIGYIATIIMHIIIQGFISVFMYDEFTCLPQKERDIQLVMNMIII
jgi:hypothetical protein